MTEEMGTEEMGTGNDYHPWIWLGSTTSSMIVFP